MKTLHFNSQLELLRNIVHHFDVFTRKKKSYVVKYNDVNTKGNMDTNAFLLNGQEKPL